MNLGKAIMDKLPSEVQWRIFCSSSYSCGASALPHEDIREEAT